MKKIMKVFFISTALFVSPSGANIDAPETVIQLSIADLIPRIKKVPGLSSQYANEVARALNSQRVKINDCLSLTDSDSLNLTVDIAIEAVGHAREVLTSFVQVSNGLQDRLAVRCLSVLLERVKYPQHSLKSAVNVKLPLSFQREAL